MNPRAEFYHLPLIAQDQVSGLGSQHIGRIVNIEGIAELQSAS